MADVMDMPSESQDRGREKSLDGSLPPPLPPLPSARKRYRDSRDYHYDSRNRYPPLPPLPRGDRDRDYRRRSSPSPLPYRDRQRSLPGGFKRSKRDDGFDRRRDDRRYGYDHGRGYDGGGRGGYSDERSHGRFMNRQAWCDPSGSQQTHCGCMLLSHSLLSMGI